MGNVKNSRLIEVILRCEQGKTDLASLSRISALSHKEVRDAIGVLEEEYQRDAHGIELVLNGGEYRFTPKIDLQEKLGDRYAKKTGVLSKAAIETLAIVAYSQPVTKAEIESLRGVGADGMIKLLLEEKLIRSLGRRGTPGRPIQYGTSKEFLKRFNLNSISDLPKLDEVDRARFQDDKGGE